jgi:hypothetical protein
VAGLRQYLVAVEGPLQMVGIVPFGRSPVDGGPDGHDESEPGHQRGEQEPRMPAHLEARVTPPKVMALAVVASRDYRATTRPAESPAP